MVNKGVTNQDSNGIMRILKRKVQFANDCRYLIKRQLDPLTEIDPEAEERISNGGLTTSLKSYVFKENFCNILGKSPMGVKLEDYKEDALAYLEESFPFCFNINLRDEPEMFGNNSFGIDFAFYAMCLGANEEQLRNIRPVLRKQKLTRFKAGNKFNFEGEPQKRTVKIDDVKGSSVDKYQADNLLDALTNARDKNIGNFIQYIMKSGGLVNPGNVFKGVCFFQDESNNIFVSEGNHRVLTYQALKKVKEYVTGKSFEGIEIDGTVQRVRTKTWDFSDR